MVKIQHPTLSGGIFFALLLKARKPRTKNRNRNNSGTDGLSQEKMFIELAKIIYPSLTISASESTLRKNIGDYRQCLHNGATSFEIVFEQSTTGKFDVKIKTEYKCVLDTVANFIESFIDTDKAETLVKTLLETIELDSNYKNAVFYVDDTDMAVSEFLN